MKIDINCDVGEGIENEHLLMPYISSCSIACGGHFGNIETIDKTIQLSIQNNIKIGAHPSFPDKENFGRKSIQISDEDLCESIKSQLDLFLERMSFFNTELHHIKPHGALYNKIAVEEKMAKLFLKITKTYLKNAYLYVPYSSVIESLALKNNIAIKYEAFADRNYASDLKLVSRSKSTALISSKEEVAHHVMSIIKTGKVTTLLGERKPIKADTFCVHGDTKNAFEILKHLKQELAKNNIFLDK